MKASELATLVGGRMVGPDREFSGVAPLDKAGPSHLAYAVAPSTVGTGAGVLLASRESPGTTTVVVDDPRLAFATALEALFPQLHPRGVQPGAFVHPDSTVHESATVYPGAWVGPRVQVGARSVIFPNAVLLADCEVGRDCRVGPGAVLGYAGFGVCSTPSGPKPMPQQGRVVIEDGVCIGANTCVDRAFLEETRIGSSSQLDNLVQVGHNCRLEEGVVIAAQCGLSGSVHLEKGVVLAGQVGVADHVTIGAGAAVGGQSGLNRDLQGGRRWMGTPAMSIELAARVYAALKALPDLLRRVRRLEKAMGLPKTQKGRPIL